MSALLRIAGVLCLTAGLLLCLPGAVVALSMALGHGHDLGGVSISIAGGSTLSLTGNQVLPFLASFALVGICLLIVGFYWLFSCKSGR